MKKSKEKGAAYWKQIESNTNPQDFQIDCQQKIENITQNHFPQTEKAVADLKKIVSQISSD